MTACIYVVDDDPVIREAIGGYLSSVGFAVECFASAHDFRAAVSQCLPDIVISDIIMPQEDGLSLLRWFREFSAAPVIMLSSQGATTDRVVGLELGADDYLVKPCEPRELLARVRTQLRRLKIESKSVLSEAGAASTQHEWIFAGNRLDERAMKLYVAGVEVELARKPMEVLLLFLRRAGELITKEQLLEVVWPGRIVSDASLTNCIGKLRAALGDHDQRLIKAIYGYGYRFECQPESPAGKAG
ncbi:MAG: response regulator transcription factor [Thiolinea sp.]